MSYFVLAFIEASASTVRETEHLWGDVESMAIRVEIVFHDASGVVNRKRELSLQYTLLTSLVQSQYFKNLKGLEHVRFLALPRVRILL